jgi:hypothetical protein
MRCAANERKRQSYPRRKTTRHTAAGSASRDPTLKSWQKGAATREIRPSLLMGTRPSNNGTAFGV